MITRRHIITGAAAGLGLAATGARVRAQTKLELGNATLHSLSDGTLSLPRSFLLGGLPEAELEPILQRHGVSGDMFHPACNVTLLQDGERTVLFDAGSGTGFMPSAGLLPETLDLMGVAVEDITHVVLTHAHPDHLWGVLDDFDDPLFYNAEHMIGRAELEYWVDPNTASTIGADRASFAVGAARRLDAIADSLTVFDDGDEILPGVAAFATHGHTPGHMSFEVRRGGDPVMVVGDAIGNHHVAFERPDWPSGSDQDAATGATTRTRLLDRLASEQMRLIGFHLPDGGIGHAERRGDTYSFVSEV